MYTCKKCGSSDFWLEESLGWKCYVDEDNVLCCKDSDNEVESISCWHCGAKVEEGLGAFKDWNY